MVPLPEFNEAGLLPPGDYVLTVQELRESVLVTGPPGEEAWDAVWRGRLVDNLDSILQDLWGLGIDYVIVDGSFVEKKDRPGDIDAYFPIAVERWVTREVEQGLNARRGEDVWTWDTGKLTRDPGTGKPKLPFWHKYQIDLYPDYGQLADGLKPFSDFFRQTRSGEPKGVVKIPRI